ncbi:hypothetical protein HQN86_00480 [Pedobacter panaciterrae]|uniref:hypothetical protein n=1 Tax=Pedobacter panaciterrae TaxID=363849 RepID=UPI00155DB534|nr:hypothetical protein [Pedobacter panaciterrae]NQX52078.1 hypothetical protein [Pedobacter panaciterrae]
MKKLKIILPGILSLCTFVCLGLSAQETDKSMQNSRASFLSKKFSLTATEAKSIVVFMDSTTQAMNKVFQDSTLTSEVKIMRLKNLEKARTAKMKQIISKKSDARISRDQKRRGDY